MKVLVIFVLFCVAASHAGPLNQQAEKQLEAMLGNVGAYMCAGVGSTICGKVEKCCERMNEAPGDFLCCRPGEACDHYNDPQGNNAPKDCCCGAGTKCGPDGECLMVL